MSNQTLDNNKRIAKNTLLLYLRMIVTMAISLYTSRVILQALGINDYGIYNVVGGVVTMFSMLSGSLSAAISRYITFELGKGDEEKLKIVFSTSVNIQIILSILTIILAETVGLWFLNSKMVIPMDRMVAANWVYQLSLLTFVVNLVSIPYNAVIVAHERMKAFAYISILEAIGKLGISFLIIVMPFDRLITYAVFLAAIAIVIRIVYGMYCNRNFAECSYRFSTDRIMLKEMFGFAGWNFIGATSGVLKDQGGNVLLNIFFGPAVNAARGIAQQVHNSLLAFANNFIMALNPQITKSYAAGDKKYFMTLLFQGSRFSYYLFFIVSLPILVNTDYILHLWLGKVPEYAVVFLRLTLILEMSDIISTPLITAMLATGDIKKYQIVVGGIQLLNIPVAYIFFKLGFSPESLIVVSIVVSQMCLFFRLYMLQPMIGLPFWGFLKNVYINVIAVSLAGGMFPILLSLFFAQSFVNFIVLCLMSIACSMIAIAYIGCEKKERQLAYTKITNIKEKIFSKYD